MRERLVGARALEGLFRAAHGDDLDALTCALPAFPHLLNVRQNRRGQRASLAHAAAAGGSLRLVPVLFRAMHAAAIAPYFGFTLRADLGAAGALPVGPRSGEAGGV